jgi:hypothetical protein
MLLWNTSEVIESLTGPSPTELNLNINFITASSETAVYNVQTVVQMKQSGTTITTTNPEDCYLIVLVFILPNKPRETCIVLYLAVLDRDNLSISVRVNKDLLRNTFSSAVIPILAFLS